MTAVIDASVAAKWLFMEPDSDKAHDLLEGVNHGQVTLIAPDLLLAEIGSMLWKRVLREGVSFVDATAQYARFKRVRLGLVGIRGLVDSALLLALRQRHPIYDCIYLALALEAGCDLITADEKLHRTFSPNFPQVRRLRDWQP
jgi:predicted nucleic acid-binding protein